MEINEEIKFLRNVADELQKVKARLARENHDDTKTWDELYFIKQTLLETKIAELKKELKEGFVFEKEGEQ